MAGLIGAAIGTGASIYGGMKASKLQAQNIKELQEQMKEIQAQKSKSAVHTDAQLYGGPNAAEQAAVTNAQQINEEAIQAANNNVVGSTPERAALEKQAAAQQVGSILQNNTVQRNQRQDQAWAQGQQEAQQWQNYLNSTRQQIASARTAQAQAIQTAAAGVANAAGGLSFGKAGKVAL